MLQIDYRALGSEYRKNGSRKASLVTFYSQSHPQPASGHHFNVRAERRSGDFGRLPWAQKYIPIA